MRKIILLALLLCLAAVPAFADAYSDLDPGIVCVVAQETVPLRSEPDISTEPIIQLSSGIQLTLLSLDEETGWAYVQLEVDAGPDIYRGYVRSGALMNGDYVYWDMLRVVNPSPGERLNLREKPSADSPSLGKYYTGTLVVNYDSVYHPRGEGYLRVRVGNQIGYMATDYLAPSNSSNESELPTAVISNTGGSGGNLRETPSLDGKLFALYPNGTEVTILGVTYGDWCHVMINGKTGFMLADKLSPTVTFDEPDFY